MDIHGSLENKVEKIDSLFARVVLRAGWRNETGRTELRCSFSDGVICTLRENVFGADQNVTSVWQWPL